MTETQKTGFPLSWEWRNVGSWEWRSGSYPKLKTSETERTGFPPAREWRDFRFLFLVFCSCGNDEILSFRNLSEKIETAPPSFPRRRESRHSMLRQFIGNDWNSKNWIPTFVGMTECRFVGMTGCRFPYGWIRHSRAGGNLDIQC